MQPTYHIYNFFFNLLSLPFLSMGFPSGSDGKESASNTGEPGLILGLGRSPGEGQYSGLRNSMDRGAWRATDHGVENCKEQT